MKKTVSIFLVLLMLCSLCGVSALADDASDVVGTYRLVSFKAGDQEITEELIALMESAGKTATLTVNEDGFNGGRSAINSQISISFIFFQWERGHVCFAVAF